MTHVTTPLPAPVRPMLAVAGSPPEVPRGWSFEFKWDGVRAVVGAAGDRLRVTSRNGNDITGGYPNPRELHQAGDETAGRLLSALRQWRCLVGSTHRLTWIVCRVIPLAA